jgi:hypothetical protein
MFMLKECEIKKNCAVPLGATSANSRVVDFDHSNGGRPLLAFGVRCASALEMP